MINGVGKLGKQAEGAERRDVMNGEKHKTEKGERTGEATAENRAEESRSQEHRATETATSRRGGSTGPSSTRRRFLAWSVVTVVVFLGPGARGLACLVRLCVITQD